MDIQASLRTLRFVLYSRSYCHLCDDMLAALLVLQSDALRFEVEVIDVDLEAALVERFDELVPVLFGAGESEELCHYFLDPDAVRRHVAAASRLD